MNDFSNYVFSTYVLFFFAALPEGLKEMVDSICTQCPQKDTCHGCGKKIKPVGVYDTDNLKDINQTVQYLDTELKSTFALLMDTEKEVLYLYIGELDSNDLKYMILYINMMFGKSYKVENVVDLRDTLKFKIAPGVN